jgi:hypothetical protein
MSSSTNQLEDESLITTGSTTRNLKEAFRGLNFAGSSLSSLTGNRLEYYEKRFTSASFTGAVSVPAAAVNMVKIDAMVHLNLAFFVDTNLGAAVITSNAGVVPTGFRPPATATAYARVVDGGVAVAGEISVTSAGTIIISRAGGGNFSAGATSGLSSAAHLVYSTI